MRKVLTGEKKVKPKMYIMTNNRGYKLKSLKWRISLRMGGVIQNSISQKSKRSKKNTLIF